MQRDDESGANSKATIDRSALAPGFDDANSFVAFAAAFIVYIVVASGWKALALPSGASPEAGYQYTKFLAPSFLWQAVVFAIIGSAAGYITGRTWPVAFGLILPIPIAMTIEISKDPTSHNLFPFEVLFMWIPVFLLAFVAARVGRRIRSKEVSNGETMGSS